MTAFQLRSWDRRQLLKLLDQTHDARQFRRAQALLWLHEGQPVLRVAELLRVQPRTVYNWAHAFRERTDLDLPVHAIETSRKSVSRAITRLGIRWKRPRHRLGLRPETWRQAKGGSKAG